MDYKELIERLKECAEKCKQGKVFGREAIEAEDTILDGVDAIKTLLAEREAEVKEIEKRCDNCEYLDVSAIEWPCAGCGAECHKWKWRGPQKGGDG